MHRVAVYRIGIAVVGLAAFFLLWSFAYEVVVALRWAPTKFPSEGSMRWALLRMQNADRSLSTLFVAWSHFYARVMFPATQAEALVRAGIAAGGVVATLAAGGLMAFIYRRQTPYGAARFGTLLDAAKQGLTARQGIILGTLNGTLIRSDEPAHALVVGPSRSGKGTGFVLPNGYFWQGSAVFFDPKRENFHALAAHRERMGNKVFMFSPGSRDTHRYNPLDFVRRDERMATDCLVVASFIIPEKVDDTWSSAGRLLLCALIGYVLASPLTATAQHMRRVARMTTTGKDISSVLKAVVQTERDHLPTWITDSFNQYIALEPETRNSAVFNINLAMAIWNNGLISAATETSDFDIRELRKAPMTIFIGCTIAELAIFRPLIRILFQQIHDLMMVDLPGPDEPHQVLLMLDEFYHVGRMDSLISKITISAGYGFRMAIVLQGISQLDELYGRNTRITTLAGSQIKLFIQINDLETSDFVSEMLGDRTQVYKTPIQKPGQGVFAPRVWAPHYTPRRLRSPLELREMSARTSILMVKNSRSFELTKIRHFADAPFKRLFEASKDRMINLPALAAWHDEPPFDEPEVAAAQQTTAEVAARTKPKSSKPRVMKTAKKADPVVTPAEAAKIDLPSRTVGAQSNKKFSRGKPLTIGPAPDATGEDCNIRSLLRACEDVQDENFAAVLRVMGSETASMNEAKNALRKLQHSFGDEPGRVDA